MLLLNDVRLKTSRQIMLHLVEAWQETRQIQAHPGSFQAKEIKKNDLLASFNKLRQETCSPANVCL